MNTVNQVICTLIVSYICLNLGVMYAWPSSTIQLFSTSNTTLSRPMSDTEQALFGSLFSVTALVSNPLAGFSLELFGRKKSCIFFAVPQVIAWTIMSVCNQVEIVLAAVCISGLGSGLLTIVPLYVSEVSQETVRGTLTAFCNVFWGLGIMFSYLLGGLLTRDMMNYANLTISIVGVVMLTYVKESPVFLINKGLEEEAANSIAFYRSMKPDSKEVVHEISVIRKAQITQINDVSPEEEALNTNAPSKLSLIQFLKKSKSTRHGFVLSMFLVTFTVLQGMVVVQVYFQPLLDEAIPSVSGNTVGIAFALACSVFAFLAALLLDVVGRRALLIYPSFTTGLSCLALGSQIQFQWGPHWITGVFLFCYGASYTFGAATVPYVYMAEIFLPEVSNILVMLGLEWAWACTFIVLFVFNPLVTLLGLGPIFYIFAIASFITAIFSAIYLPETKALTVDVIQTLMVSKRQY